MGIGLGGYMVFLAQFVLKLGGSDSPVSTDPFSGATGLYAVGTGLSGSAISVRSDCPLWGPDCPVVQFLHASFSSS